MRYVMGIRSEAIKACSSNAGIGAASITFSGGSSLLFCRRAARFRAECVISPTRPPPRSGAVAHDVQIDNTTTMVAANRIGRNKRSTVGVMIT
jgi:hypothetical protein